MHGGRQGEGRKRRRHMWPVPAPGTTATTATGASAIPGPPLVEAAAADSGASCPSSFLKDGRKICVGDCALFQSGNCPPFIGIVRWFTAGKEEHLKLGVNRLFRPSDIKIATGNLLEAAPNEVFYSFQKDEISAELLLHPCKVAFLRKGVQLPSGISSFVCRRVYDVANECLWWLTDQGYINERQEEVAQLLDKTQIEMHAAVQSGGRSPKQSNGPSTQPLKSTSDSVQSSSTSYPSQAKGRKRGDKGDLGSESVKRERCVKVDNVDSGNCKFEIMIKTEIAKIADKGGLINNDAVERLVQLMQLDRALDKLPVNLDALQTCNIGKSVNHLRGHRNLEIQKKARSLVDTWKKRVDAEMTKLEMTKLSETKSVGSNQAVSWPGKSGFSEVSQGGNRRSGSSEAAVKSGGAQTSSCKSLPSKIGHGDSNVKMNPGQSGSPKLPSVLSASVTIGTKDSQSKTGGSSWTGEPPMTIKEEKSSSSSQSQNNSQSCSSDHTKSMCSTWKEDARSSAAGSMNSGKTSGGTSRNRKSSTSFVGTTVSGIQKDSGSGRSRSLRNTASEKAPQPGTTGEKAVDVPVVDHGNNHRLIVRLPNPGRSPARSTSGGSFEDPSLTGSRASSPGVPEKNEHIDRRTKLNSGACQASIAADVNAESWQSNDLKGGVGSDDGDRSTTAVLDEERSSTDETVKAVGTSRGASSSEPKSGKSFEASLSSINALIESCVKYSEASASSGGDDSGMNLLASVAAGEISKSDVVSPTDSPGGNSPAAEDPYTVNEVQSTFSSDNVVTSVSGHPAVNAEDDHEKHGSIAAALQVRDESKQNCAVSISSSFCDSKSIVSTQETKSPGAYREHPVSALVSCKDTETIVKSEGKLDSVAADGPMSLLTSPPRVQSLSDEDSSKQFRKKRKASGSVTEGLSDFKRKAKSPSSELNVPLGDETGLHHVASPSIKHEKDSVEGASSCPADKQGIMDVSHDATPTDQLVHPATSVCPDYVCGNNDKAMTSSSTIINLDVVDELKKKESENMGEKIQLEASDNEKNDHTSIVAPALDRRIDSSSVPASHSVEDLEKDITQDLSSLEGSHVEASTMLEDEAGQFAKATCSNFSRAEEVGEKVASSLEASSAVISPVPDTSRNCDFDLNEGLCVDEGNPVEPVTPSVLGRSSSVHLPPFSLSPVSTVSSVPITVAAPAKGPFLSETLLKGKGEPGWKGSAATSAFRPAEPRKVQEMPLGMSDAPSSETTSSKQCRPVLDIDLNVADERVAEEIAVQSSSQERHSGSRGISNCDPPIRSSVGLDLDLNQVDDSTDNGQVPGNASRRLEVPLLPVRSASGTGGANVLRDFDLNNGPSLDEVSSEPVSQSQQTKAGSLPFIPSLRMNSNELGNLSTWFPPGNSYPAVAIPSFLPDRGDQPYPIVAGPSTQRILSSANGGSTFGSDLYRGSVLSSSPAMAFTPAAPFPYAGFPFGSSFPLASTSFSGGSMTHADSATGGGPCFPAIPTPLIGSAGAASSPYVRPYVISLHEGSTSSGTESSQKWGQQNLDLNAGPGGVDIEGRVERSPMASRQLSVPSSQAFAEEQVRMFQAAVSRGLKRKDPEGGWDAERFTYK
ncbi:hypothetical protein Taro_010631 [Colocasia esculenta]|uniref:TFIIS N-terminal domain-containing protein n=1 Tax=Colocasia esculenta TaxID=4460 RepID=A0A843U3V9_COLES|nr:hypothetical protein [Colocasia esculenta]